MFIKADFYDVRLFRMDDMFVDCG